MTRGPMALPSRYILATQSSTELDEVIHTYGLSDRELEYHQWLNTFTSFQCQKSAS